MRSRPELNNYNINIMSDSKDKLILYAGVAFAGFAACTYKLIKCLEDSTSKTNLCSNLFPKLKSLQSQRLSENLFKLFLHKLLTSMTKLSPNFPLNNSNIL